MGYLASEILGEKLASASGCGKIDLPPTQFDFEIRFDLFSGEVWALAETIVRNVNIVGAERCIPLGHATLYDGSEQDLWAHCGKADESIVLLELRHHYIDQHFILFHLWRTDRKQPRTYPIELFLPSDVMAESLSGGRKILEFFVKPVTLMIHAKNLDLSPFLPTTETLARTNELIAGYPVFRFWRLFEAGDFAEAGNVTLEILRSEVFTKGISAPFWRSASGLCAYLASDFPESAGCFLQAGAEYSVLGSLGNADLCFFYAIEAGKRTKDMNTSLDIAGRVIDAFAFEENTIVGAYKQQLVNIVKSYYTHSGDYIGPTVQCRRVIELYLSRLLESHFSKPIKQQVKEAKAAREISKDAGIGCNAVIQLAAKKGIITDDERTVASTIKDFGNKIHDEGGVGNAIDAKYAIQACLHLLHRKSSKTSGLTPISP